MTQRCLTCTHKACKEIEREYVQGISIAQLSQKYGISYSSVRHHVENHISRQMIQAYNQKNLVHQTDLFQRIDQIVQRAEDIFNRNYEKNRDRTALKALSEQRQTFELLAKIAAHAQQMREREDQLQAEESEYEAEQQAAEGLQNLTDDEIDVLQNLQHKMTLTKAEARTFDAFNIGTRTITLKFGDDEDQITDVTIAPDELKRQPKPRSFWKKPEKKSKLKRTKKKPVKSEPDEPDYYFPDENTEQIQSPATDSAEQRKYVRRQAGMHSGWDL